MRCKAEGCGTEIKWARNSATGKNVPLVPFLPLYPKAHRYTLLGTVDGVLRCERDDEGAWMSHYADCKGARQFSGKNR